MRDQESLDGTAGYQPSMAESESLPGKSVLLVASSSPARTHFRELIATGGYRVAAVSSANEALRLLRIEAFALAVVHEVDDKTPSRLSREMKALTDEDLRPPLPVVLLASTFDPDYAVRCLRAGSDDYITGPHLEPRVLLARLEAVLRSYRRQRTEQEREKKQPARIGAIMIDPERFRVEVNGSAVEVTRIQFTLLYAMASQPDRTFTRPQLRGIIAELGGNLDDGSIKSHIHHLRRRLGVAGRQIETVRGLGYRLVT
ncbi:response regulator transcription factor [Lacipirellula parvula]|nr:response regulator transcription factor [Lacipirellula parvula]